MKISKLKKNTILKNGTIIDPLKNFEKKGDIHIQNGLIKAVGKISPHKSVNTIDCKGLIITHGFCDLHAHLESQAGKIKKI